MARAAKIGGGPFGNLFDEFMERGEVNGRRLGNWLARHKGRVINGKVINGQENGRGRIAWYVSEPALQESRFDGLLTV